MPTKTLTKQDLWDSVIGGTVLGTGGGGIAASRELFDAVVAPIFQQGLAPQLVDVADLSDDQAIFMPAGAGGGVEREIKERYLLHPGFEVRFRQQFDSLKWVQGQIPKIDRLYPLPHWAKPPTAEWSSAAERRLVELRGTGAAAYIPFEIGPNVFNLLCSSALKGKPVVDADVAGYRAVPEFSLCALNIAEAPITPVVLTTAWGDMIVYEKLLSWQRLEDLTRHLAVASGGGVGGMLSVSGADLKRGAVPHSISKSVSIGKAIREASAQHRDPVGAAIQASGGYLLFQGRISAFLYEDKEAFIWGDARIDGTGKFEGHDFRVWYKNENHIAWLDGKPYVTSPDLICIIDSHSAVGLSNFWQKDFEWGRDVSVIGIPCAEVWRTPRGLKIFNPWRFGFYVNYVPVERLVA